MRGVFGRRHHAHVGVGAWNVVNGRVTRLLQRQRARRIGNRLVAEAHAYPLAGRRDRDRMIGARNFHRFPASMDTAILANR